MNKITKNAIDAITNAEETYQNQVQDILMHYRERKGRITKESQKYKDEEGFVREHLPQEQQSARQELWQAEQLFRGELKRNISVLKSELSASINAPIPPAFAERLSFYRTAGLTPTRTEAEALLALAGKSPVALRALGKLLNETSAPVKLESRGITDYEADLQNLDYLAEMPLVHSPYQVHTELCDLMVGQEKPSLTANGWRAIGYVWLDSPDLLMQGTAVTSRLKAIKDAGDSWATDISCSIREREDAAEQARLKEEAELSGKLYKPEPVPVSNVKIENRDDSPLELAAELGRQAAKAKSVDLSGYSK